MTCIVVLFFCLGAKGQSRVGIFESHQDIGQPKLKGNVQYDASQQTYLFSGSGRNIWDKEDQFHFAWKKLKGDFMIQARVHFIGSGMHAHRKAGIMLREDLTPDGRCAMVSLHGDGLTSLQFRSVKAGSIEELKSNSIAPMDIQLERKGSLIILYGAAAGENWKTLSMEVTLSDEVFAGLFICSHDEATIEQATFSNVRIVIPPAKGYVPYQDYIGSHLEIMNVSTGHRKILMSVPYSLQAPNWTPDNKSLIYNAEGKLYRFALANGNVDQLNTG